MQKFATSGHSGLLAELQARMSRSCIFFFQMACDRFLCFLKWLKMYENLIIICFILISLLFLDTRDVERTVTKCVNFTHTPDNPLRIQLECSEGYVIAVSRVLKARREESVANINWCNSAEFSDSDCIHYEKYLTQTLKSMCNTKSLCTQKFTNAANEKCQQNPPAGYYPIDYIHVEYNCVQSE